MSFPAELALLIVDDDDRLRELAAMAAQSLSCFASIVTAEHGAAALDWLESNEARCDVILTDLSMPVMDGFDFVRHIRAHPRWRDLPVVMFSSSSLPNDREHAKAAGCTAFFEKPGTLNELQGLLTTVCEMAREARVG